MISIEREREREREMKDSSINCVECLDVTRILAVRILLSTHHFHGTNHDAGLYNPTRYHVGSLLSLTMLLASTLYGARVVVSLKVWGPRFKREAMVTSYPISYSFTRIVKIQLYHNNP